ncbi:hypothetical protein TURU_044480 [Turdus rufiventris]|nr:hypothetical protein TURU_044480 [Turdus rufiventris]
MRKLMRCQQRVFDCNFESPCELEYSFTSKDQETPNNAWVRLNAEEISQLNLPDGLERDHSESTPKGVKEFAKETEVVLYLTALKCNSFSDYFAVRFAATPSLVQPGQK